MYARRKKKQSIPPIAKLKVSVAPRVLLIEFPCPYYNMRMGKVHIRTLSFDYNNTKF